MYVMFFLFYCIIDETVEKPQQSELQSNASELLWNGNGTVPLNTSEIKNSKMITVMYICICSEISLSH